MQRRRVVYLISGGGKRRYRRRGRILVRCHARSPATARILSTTSSARDDLAGNSEPWPSGQGVEHVIVHHIDEELRGGGIRVAGARHGEIVPQSFGGRCWLPAESGARVGCSFRLATMPPPWIVKPSMTRWNTVPS